MDARPLQRRARIDAADVGMSMRRAHNGGMQLISEIEIVEEAALAPQQARVLAAQYRLPDGKFTHDRSEPALVATTGLSRNGGILRRSPA
jgi:hypothetical protein